MRYNRFLLILVVVNVAIGAWLGIPMIIQFTIFLNGGTIYEPNSVIATAELCLAYLFTLWFVVIFPVLFKRGLKDGL